MEAPEIIQAIAPKHALIPTDFGQCARNACEYAAQLFQEEGTRFTLLNTFESDGKDYLSYSKTSTEHEGDLKAEQTWFGEVVGDKDRVGDLLVSGKVEYLPDSLIRENAVDIIVMGSGGKSEEENKFDDLGSGYTHASKLLSRLDRTFLVVPHGHKFKPVKTILITTDLDTKPTEEHAAMIKWLVNKFSPELHYGHICSEFPENMETGKDFLDPVTEWIGAKNPEFHEIQCESSVDGIYKLANTVGADMIVAISHHRNLIQRLTEQSITRVMAETLPFPMLILPK